MTAVGAALSANKGAAAMLQALVDNIDSVIPGGRVESLSTYPNADRAENRNPNLEIISLTPREMIFPILPLALLIWLVRGLGGSGRALAFNRSLRSLMDSAVVADLAGISFVDGRGLPTLVYNVLTTGIPLLVGARVIKCSQAMGPFGKTSTRVAARVVLPRVGVIVARGEETVEHLRDLGLENVVEGADLAFVMKTDESHRSAAHQSLEQLGDQSFLVVSPSSVVKGLCAARDIDYVRLMADTIEKTMDETGLGVAVVAHSARPGRREGRMNDIPVCREVYDAIPPTHGLLLIDDSLDPAVLREIIGQSRGLVASRFHAMISGLATTTPTVVVGWSHKYAEVMREFGLQDYVIPYSAFTSSDMAEMVARMVRDNDTIRSQIGAVLPQIEKSSMKSFEALRKEAGLG